SVLLISFLSTSSRPSTLLISLHSPPPPPTSTLFPYTTLFRSRQRRAPSGRAPHPGRHLRHAVPRRDLRPGVLDRRPAPHARPAGDRKSTRLNSSHQIISYAVFCLKKKKNETNI